MCAQRQSPQPRPALHRHACRTPQTATLWAGQTKHVIMTRRAVRGAFTVAVRPIGRGRGMEREIRTFHAFRSPNALAESLDTAVGRAADHSIDHLKWTIAHYLPALEAHLSHGQVLFVGDERHFNRDLVRLAAAVHDVRGGSPASFPAQLQGTVPQVHAMPDAFRDSNFTSLSVRGRCLLERHLAEDYRLTDLLHTHGLIDAPYPRLCQPGAVLPPPAGAQARADPRHDRVPGANGTRAAGAYLGTARPWVEGKCAAWESCDQIYAQILTGELYAEQSRLFAP